MTAAQKIKKLKEFIEMLEAETKIHQALAKDIRIKSRNSFGIRVYVEPAFDSVDINNKIKSILEIKK